MDTVYLIGNGFDVNLDLPTKYSDFYRHYLGLDRTNDSENISRLKDHLEQYLNGKDKVWSDLEEAMGIYTSEFSSYADMEEVYDDLNEEMQKYICSVENSSLTKMIDVELFKKNISSPQSFLTLAEQNTICEIYKINYGVHRISIINFNYTTTIEKIVNYKGVPLDLGPATYSKEYKTQLNNIFHIHGLTENPILGLNDPTQIQNEELRNDLDVIEYLVKPKINDVLGHLRDRQAKEAIKEAKLICIYGLSLGKTDNQWWKLVGAKLLNGSTVILFVYDDDYFKIVPRKLGRYQRYWKTKLCDAANIPNTQRTLIMSRIIVAPNTAIFNINKSSTDF